MMKFAPLERRRSDRGAFTLIEILVVIAIIAILASLLLQTSGYIQEKAGNSRAETEIAALGAALESYKIDNGTYPESDGDTLVLLEELWKNPLDDNRRPYMEIPPNMMNNRQDPEASTQLVDPFGNAYFYEFPGDNARSGEAFFDLYSKGKKGEANNDKEEKWIKNW